MNRLEAWAYLSRVFEGPSRSLQQLLETESDVEKIAWGIKKREAWLGPILPETASRYSVSSEKQDLTTIKNLGGRLVTPDDDEWPREKIETAFGFAASGTSSLVRSYQSDAVAPHALWVRGAPLSTIVDRSVAVVGTRAMSHYGKNATSMLAAGIADHHWTIISGGALGVDTVAHTEALQRQKPTVAVCARGLDAPYPRKNAELLRSIAENGCVVSEYAPGLTPHRHRFLTRNRLVAALSQGTVAVEAAWRSGALNTLSWASALGRVAMAVPGPVTNTGSLGCHERIRNKEAELVCSAEEILALVGTLGEFDPNGQYELQFAADPIQSLSRNEMRVFDSLDTNLQPTDMVATAAGIPIGLSVHILRDLEKKQLVMREGAHWRRC